MLILPLNITSFKCIMHFAVVKMANCWRHDDIYWHTFYKMSKVTHFSRC